MSNALPTPCKFKLNCRAGFSLVEVLVVTALSLILLSGIISYYLEVYVLANEKTAEIQLELVQERVLNIVENSVRLGGFIPSQWIGNQKSIYFPEEFGFAKGQVIK